LAGVTAVVARWLRRTRRLAALGRHQTRIGLWLLRDILRFAPGDALRVVATEFLGIAIRYGSLGLLYVFVNALQDLQPVQIPPAVPLLGGGALPLRDFFAFGVLTGVVLMSGATLLQFLVRLAALRLAEHYERFCGRRLLALASRLPSPKAAWATRIFGREPLHVFFAYARTCGFVTRQIVLLLPSFVSLLAGCAILLVLDAPTTLLLAGLAALVFLAQYPLNNLSAQASSRAERRRRDAMRQVSRLLTRQRTAAVPLTEDGAVLERLFAKEGQLRRDISLYGDRIRGGEAALLVARLGGGVLLGIAILVLGGGILTGERSWAEIAVYVTVARYVLKDFAAAGKFMSGLSRQFGPVERYIRFVRSAALADLEPPAPARPEGPLRLRVPELAGAAPELALEPGSVAAVISRDPQLPLGALVAAQAEAGPGGLGPVAWIDAELLAPDAPLVANLAVPAGTDLRAVERDALRLAPAQAGLAYPPGWLLRTVAELPTPPPDWLICALKVAVAARRGASCLAAEAGSLLALPEAARRGWAELFPDGPLLVLHRDLQRVGQAGESVALLAEDGRLSGWLRLGPATRRTLALSFRALVERARTLQATARPDEEELVEG
jgi:ABC-type multidrug transport system fused ATPase/permease subunit